MGIGGNVFVIGFVKERMHGGAGELRAVERVSMRAKQKSKRNAVMIFWGFVPGCVEIRIFGIHA
jgi:hypothetical protein